MDTIIRTSASSTSWSTVNELTALILWIVNCLSSFSILLRNANKSLEQFVRIKHSTQFLFGNSDRISSTTSTQTRKSKNYNAYGLSIDYPSRLETVYIDWPDLSGDYCASDSICETSDELTTKLKYI